MADQNEDPMIPKPAATNTKVRGMQEMTAAPADKSRVNPYAAALRRKYEANLTASGSLHHTASPGSNCSPVHDVLMRDPNMLNLILSHVSLNTFNHAPLLPAEACCRAWRAQGAILWRNRCLEQWPEVAQVGEVQI